MRLSSTLEKLKELNHKKVLLVLLGVWFVVNVIQAVTTGVIEDETYYYFYSQRLAWGYFDHPPMVALMIKLSSLLFSGALSVRFATIVLQLFTLVLIWYTIDKKYHNSENLLLLFGLLSSVVMFVVYGFITTPDSPLLFFTALLLFSYKRFLNKESLLNTLLLSISMAGLVYSKYQGGLVIILLILSNPKLLINYRFILSALFALLLYTPHLFWQFENGFPSFMYHTLGRAKPFKWRYFFEYLPNQAASFNPTILGIALYLILKEKAKSLFERSHYFIVLGMILFFWIATYRGHSQPQWTIAASIPMVLIIFHYAINSSKIKRYVNKYVYTTIPILLILRVIIACDSIPLKLEFYNKDRWAKEIENIAKDRTVVFRDTYQKPSLYRFYTKKDATTINSVFYRKNQYDLYYFNNQYLEKEAVIFTNKEDSLALITPIFDNDTLYYRFVKRLITPSQIAIEHRLNNRSTYKRESNNELELIITNNGSQSFMLSTPIERPSFHLVLTGMGRRVSLNLEHINGYHAIPPNSSIPIKFNLKIPKAIESGKWGAIFSIKVPPFKEGFNSTPFIIYIE